MNSTFSTGALSNDTDDDPGRRNSTFSGFWRGRAQYDDLGPTTRVSVWLLVGAALVFLVLRVYCKIVRHRRLHADDGFLIAAWVCAQGSAVLKERTDDGIRWLSSALQYATTWPSTWDMGSMCGRYRSRTSTICT